MSDFDDELHDALAAGAAGAPTSSGLAVAARVRHRRRRVRTIAGSAAAAALAVVTPVVVLAGGEEVDREPVDEPAPSSDIRVGCDVDEATWPVSAMGGGVETTVDDAAIRDAFADLIEVAGMETPHALKEQGAEASYVVLAETADELFLGVGPWSAEQGPGKGAQFLRVDLAEDPVRVGGWGDCSLSVALPPGRSQVEVKAPKGGVDRTASELRVLVNERECTSGRDPEAYLGEPTVVEGSDRVLVTLTSEAVTGGADCQGNPSVPMTIQLAEPLGDRELFDAGTWPPTPIAVAAAEAVGDDWHTIGWRGLEVDVPSDWTRTDCPVVGVRFGPPYDHLPDRPHDGECLEMSGVHIAGAAGFQENPRVQPGKAYASGPGVPRGRAVVGLPDCRRVAGAGRRSVACPGRADPRLGALNRSRAASY